MIRLIMKRSKQKSTLVPRNYELAVVLKNDHRRLKIRIVTSEKMKLKTKRSRRKVSIDIDNS